MSPFGLRCPCGRAARISTNPSGRYFVRCEIEGCWTGPIRDDPDEAARAWINPRARAGPPPPLTPRESEVLSFIRGETRNSETGLALGAVSVRFGISSSTAHEHVASLREKGRLLACRPGAHSAIYPSTRTIR